MRIFATREYHLSRFPYGAKIFYTLFLLMVLLGLASCLGFLFAKSGTTTAELVEYYRQEESGFGGKTFLELLETAHFHLFSMPVFFLVLGHIFFLTSWPERWKLVVTLTAFASLLLEIALPFLIVFHSAAWAWLKHPVRAALFGSFLLFVVVPLRDMWSRGAAHTPKRPRHRPTPAPPAR